jgi:protocadherin delta 1
MTCQVRAHAFVTFAMTIITATVTSLHVANDVRSDPITSQPMLYQQTPDIRRVAQPRDPLPYYIVEELPAETPIGCIPVDAMLDRVYTVEQLRNFRYAIGSQVTADRGDRVDLFAVDAIAGIVQTATRIDRDALCSGRTMCLVLLDIVISPVEYFRIIKISIDILDVNDHAPDFGNEEIRLRISESAVVGSSYALPVAVDLDSEQFGVREYQLMEQPDFEAVTANAVESTLPFKLVFESRLVLESDLTGYDFDIHKT